VLVITAVTVYFLLSQQQVVEQVVAGQLLLKDIVIHTAVELQVLTVVLAVAVAIQVIAEQTAVNVWSLATELLDKDFQVDLVFVITQVVIINIVQELAAELADLAALELTNVKVLRNLTKTVAQEQPVTF
jgi:hypothetical protein